MLTEIEARQRSLEDGAVQVTRLFQAGVEVAQLNGFHPLMTFNARLLFIREEAQRVDRMIGLVIDIVELGVGELQEHRRAPTLCAPVMASLAKLESDIDLFLSDLD